MANAQAGGGDLPVAGPNAVFTSRSSPATDRAMVAPEHGGDGGARAMLYDALKPTTLLGLKRSAPRGRRADSGVHRDEDPRDGSQYSLSEWPVDLPPVLFQPAARRGVSGRYVRLAPGGSRVVRPADLLLASISALVRL
jgi:hypothetical protein